MESLKTVNFANVEYQVLQFESLDEVKAVHPNTAKEMAKCQHQGRLIIKQAKSKKIYSSVLKKDGTITKPLFAGY